MADCLVSFGSNQGASRDLFRAAMEALRRLPQIHQLQASELFRTKPIGNPEPQPDFLNAAWRLQTEFEPPDLFRVLQTIESDLGRVRTQRWGPRAIDLDLLLFDREVGTWTIDAEHQLQLPHPRMTFRRFMLLPAAEVAADMLHVPARMTIGQLVRHIEAQPNIIAIFTGAQRAADFFHAIDRPDRATTVSALDRPQRMTLTSEPRAADFAPGGDDFAVVPIESPAVWRMLQPNTKLIVYWAGAHGDPRRAWEAALVDEFAGPRLTLQAEDVRGAAQELDAAIAALRAGSIEPPAKYTN